MNILLTIHHELRRDAGAEGVTLALAEAYRRLGHRADVYAFDRLPKRLPYDAKKLLFPYYVRRHLNRMDGFYDVVDASSGDAWAWASAARGTKRRRVVLIARSHGLEHLAHEELVRRAREGMIRLSWKYPLYHGGFRLWEVARSFRLADGAVLLNREEKTYACGKLGLSDPAVIGNGIPQSFLGRSYEPTPMEEGEPLQIAAIGRYEPMKGTAHAAEALAPLLRADPGLRVTFFGTKHPAERVLADYPADVRGRIGVVPFYDREALPALLRGCQIQLFPSLREGFGMVVPEAMACGLAPVTTSIPGPSDVVTDGVNGLLVPPADAEALRRALARLICDRSLLDRLRKEAWRTAQRYGWDSIARRTLSYYESCRAKTARVRPRTAAPSNEAESRMLP